MHEQLLLVVVHRQTGKGGIYLLSGQGLLNLIVVLRAFLAVSELPQHNPEAYKHFQGRNFINEIERLKYSSNFFISKTCTLIIV